MKGKSKGRGRPRKRGRPSVWKRIKPRLAKMQRLYARGASITRIAEHTLGISVAAFYKLRAERPEFARAFSIAKDMQREYLERKLWDLAVGNAKRTIEYWGYYTPTKKLIITKKVTHFEPQRSAILYLLRRYHGWDKPAVNNTIDYKARLAERAMVSKLLRVAEDQPIRDHEKESHQRQGETTEKGQAVGMA